MGVNASHQSEEAYMKRRRRGAQLLLKELRWSAQVFAKLDATQREACML
ncbi:hypothetical protein HNQ38_000283 [Desulfovibrio intestinalis]|uniref:Uncharacterized protein n=1 Tax=Desulfovibrio intestinalis TaxID=58621 RepID=A0A7W8FEX8_9BACT|nr:hypothetical protein [Desulfovibrio intestinalis]